MRPPSCATVRLLPMRLRKPRVKPSLKAVPERTYPGSTSSGRLTDGVPFYELLKESGLAKSNGEARRLIKGGGGRLNDTVVSEEQASVTLTDVNDDGVIKLSAGRKRHALVVPA